MMHKYRGIVCEKKASHTVFITENGEFLRGVPLIADVQIGEEAEFHLIASAAPKRLMKPFFIAPALIAAVLLLFLVASWFPQTTTAYAYIQVEGDSTIEIGVDEEGNVMSLHSTTEIMKDWEGQPIDLVLAKAVEQVSTDNKELAVTTVYEKEDKPKLKKQIEQAIQEVKKEKPSPQKNSFEPTPKEVQPKEEKTKPPGQIKKEEKLPNPNKPATNKEQINPPTEIPVKNKETKDQSKDNKAQPIKDNKPTNNTDKVPGQEKKKNEVKSQNKSNNGNNDSKNNGNNNGNGNNKNSNN